MYARQKDKPSWSELLLSAVKEKGAIHEAYTRFWNYSAGNRILAIIQCWRRGIDPGPIASYQRWKELGRHVKKGERAIALIMPVTVKARPTDGEANGQESDQGGRRTIFVLKRNWFVLSQTEGEPYTPEPVPDWDKDRALEILGIHEEPFMKLDGNVQGYAKEETVAVSPMAALPHKTLFHEMAHVLLGHTTEGQFADTEHIPRSLQEAEAESVALICCESLGLPGAEFCRGYIQNWLQGSEIPEKSARRIFGAADRILKRGLPSTSRNEEA
jgi:antirestriction protein ArdC